ncbi:hypothetical protein K8O68_03765 [Salipaludibacillus sp. CUR1]|uniref:hypothetical protein n=1 Tax=Salipaludibacillus sp. CUR1 TaxID=2820003 RepID=UPI001E51891F|nr:hypothetical protein [Salipaludibacillus sp. CUR1]MCE7791542.1 hypothetical protein [Salipaludibacillus sp. CUR1]
MKNNKLLKDLARKYSSKKPAHACRPLRGLKVKTGEPFMIPFNDPRDSLSLAHKKNRK